MAYSEELNMFTVHYYSQFLFSMYIHTCLQFTTTPNSFSPCIYIHVYTLTNETELILSLWLVQSFQCGILTSGYVYPTFKNLLNRDYCRLCISVFKRGAVTMPGLSPDRIKASVSRPAALLRLAKTHPKSRIRSGRKRTER